MKKQKKKIYTSRVFYKKYPYAQKNIKNANGMYIFSEGKKILDVTAGSTSFAVLGWNNELVNKAIKDQLKKFSHVDFKSWTDPNLDKLSKLLLSKAEHNLDAVYHSGNSGADACEAAMKLSFLTHQSNGKIKKKWFIGRNQSYHGISSDSLSIAERPGLEIYKSFFSPYRTRVSQNHYLYEKLKNESEDDYSKRCAQELENKILKIGPNKVCAFIGETMMGGLIGDVEPSKNYWKYIRSVCTKYDVHLILDECYCGLGSSGKIYCCDWDKVTPDFIFVAKNLAAGYSPMSAVITKQKYIKKILQKFKRIIHGGTNQAFSLGIAASIACQKIIHNNKTLKNVNEQGVYMRDVLREELKNHEFFYDVRGRGLRFSFEYNCKKKNEFGLKVAHEILQKHNILISGKWHRFCFTPAFIITRDQCDKILDKFLKEFKNISKNWK